MKVLLVGDEPDVRRALEASAVDVTTADGVTEAVTAIEDQVFLVVIVDVAQPDGSGLDLVQAARRSGSTAHVIVLGTSTTETDRVDALQRGADDYVVKPFFVRELAERVLAVGRRHAGRWDTHFQRRRGDVDLPEPGVLVHVDGRIVFADDAVGELVGVSDPMLLVGRNVLDLATPTSLATATARRAEIESGRTRRSEIMQIRRADDEVVMAAVSSTTTDWHGTQARRLEISTVADAPDRLRELFIGVLGDVADAVIITDLDSHIRSWNAAAERIYGWTEQAVLGRHLLDVLAWTGDGAQLTAAWEQLQRTGRWHGTIQQVTRGGATVDILGSTTLLRDDAGEPIGIVSVNRLLETAGAMTMQELDTALAARVGQGLAADEFVVHYQPIIDLADGHVTTLEALVRWEHPERGTLAPVEFLDAAERTGLIVELGEVVLEQACRQAAAWRHAGADVGLSVNVSTRQLADPAMAQRFVEIIQASGFDPAHLSLEITETALVEELTRASHALRTLVALGVGVSIDDFGTGWASLTYLQNFPVHTLKIDRSFVAGVGGTGNDTAIVRSVLSLAAELGLVAVAEGIETHDQLERLRSMGCAFGQGYLFGRPTPASEAPIERAHRMTASAHPRGRHR